MGATTFRVSLSESNDARTCWLRFFRDRGMCTTVLAIRPPRIVLMAASTGCWVGFDTPMRPIVADAQIERTTHPREDLRRHECQDEQRFEHGHKVK